MSIPSLVKVMAAFPYTIDVSSPVSAARTMFDEHEIRHLPVIRDGKLVGMLSDRDLLFAEGVLPTGKPSSDITVEMMCSMDVFVVDISARLDEVVLEMADRRIGSALVTRNDKLVGILTTTDVCRLLGESLRERYPLDVPDEVA